MAVVIPVFRRPRLVRESLDSVLRQTRAPDRVVVVDDGSPDHTAASVEDWIAARAPSFAVTVIRQPNAGASAARNRGVAAAPDGEALAFLDSDDLWETEYLAALVPALERAPHAVAVTCDRLFVDGPKRWVESNARYALNATQELFCEGPSGTSNTIVRADAFRAVGGFCTGIPTGQDLHLMLRLSLLGGWAHVPRTLATYRRHASGEPSLGAKYDDRRVRRVRYLEQFLAEGGADALPERVWRPKMSLRWWRAGRQLVRLDRVDEARAGFRRATEIWPWNVYAWVARAQLALRGS